MMHKRFPDSPQLVLLMLCCAGCAPVAPQLDSRFGSSVRELMAQQALPPTPASAAGPAGAAGIDGAAARGALSRYRQSFQSTAPTPAPPVFFNAVGGGNAR
jgi:hypothetical protein